MKNYFNFLIVLIISVIGIDRVNIAPDNFLEFTLTPYIFFSIIFFLSLVLFRYKKINLNWIFKDIKLVFLLLSLFLFISLSVLTSVDIYFSFKRFFLFMFTLSFMILYFSSFPKSQINKNLLYGSVFGSLLYYLFNFLLLIDWFGVYNIYSSYINLNPDTLSYFIPRLGGFSLDVNRGGFVLVVFTYLLIVNDKKNNFINLLILLNVFFIFCTLSRTSIVFFIISSAIYFLLYVNKNRKFQFFKISLLSLFVFIGAISVLSKNDVIKLDEVIEERFSLEDRKHDSSASIHFMLIRDAKNEILSNLRIFFLGIGHGMSFKLIDGYRMSYSKNANYHSQYLSIFVENGFFAFISFLLLTLIYPIFFKNNIYLPLMVGSFFYNIFYQLINEPSFWLIIFLFYYANNRDLINDENIY